MTPPRGLERLAVALGHGAAWLFVAGAAISVYEVLMRYAFGAPTTWVHVTTTALCAVGFSAGGAQAMAQDAHVRITSVVERVSEPWQRASRILGLACGVFYLTALSYATVLQAVEAVWHFEGARWSPEVVPGPPHWPLPAITRAALALGALLFLGVVLQRLWHVLVHRQP